MATAIVPAAPETPDPAYIYCPNARDAARRSAQFELQFKMLGWTWPLWRDGVRAQIVAYRNLDGQKSATMRPVCPSRNLGR